jgi:hypothetical protein
MVIARKALPEGEHIEQMTLDQQRESLEADRQQLARERYWELLIAAAIGGCGVLLACLVPLVICLYVLRSLQFDSGAEAVLNELLISELTAGRTQRVLPTTERRPALDQETMPTDPAGAEDMGTDPFPF